MHARRFSCVLLFVTPWAVACQAPLPMGFSNQAYWSGLPFPSPGDLPDPGIEPGSPALQAYILYQLSYAGSPVILYVCVYSASDGQFYRHFIIHLSVLDNS